jgi:thiosulfate reductase cytochrome b subunit
LKSQQVKPQQVTIIEKHALAIRWFHWINFPLIALMIWTGVLIYWANPAYVDIPESVARSLGIAHRLSLGMAWHFFLMWFFSLNGILYVAYLILSGEWRELVPLRSSFKDALYVTLHDLKLRKTLPANIGKFNGAQRIAYSSTILMGFASLVTGLAIYKPVQLGMITTLLGGYEAARLEHFILMCAFVSFFFIHILQVAKAGWNNFRAMVSGYEIENEGDQS